MGVLLQVAYRRDANPSPISVPAPADGDPSVPWWWDRVASQARDFKLCGFTAVLLPPLLKTASGQAPGADGYGTFDDYDLGSKDECGSIPTRFGTREQLQRCVAVLHANGIDVYADVVLHQRDGSDDGTYSYIASGGAGKGRFPKPRGCFVGDPAQGFVARDPVPDPAHDYAFGDELAPINGVPRGYVRDGLVDAGDWLTRAIDLQGYRVDDVKGLAPSFVSDYLNSKRMRGGFAVAEYFDGNPGALNWWVWQSGMGGRSTVFDFALKFVLQDMCNGSSAFDMTRLDHAGFAGFSPLQAVTFVENPDTDFEDARIIWNKILGYAYILTSEGYPCVYYKDYATDPGCYGLKPLIDNLVWIHENLAFGPTVQRWKDYRCFVYERLGYPNLLVGLNSDRYDGWRTVTVQTAFGPYVQLHDYTGRAGDVWTDWQGAVTIGIPPNDDGHGYVCYSRNGYGQAFSTTTRTTTQEFDGAADLDLAPATNGGSNTVGRVWCGSGTRIDATLTVDMSGCGPGASVVLEIADAGGNVLATAQQSSSSGRATASASGLGATRWVTLRLRGEGLPTAGAPFNLRVTYTGSQTIGA
jgi:alpha-amylase